MSVSATASAAKSSTAAPAGVAVAGCGYWGKYLVRNFHRIGALAAVYDPDPAVADNTKCQMAENYRNGAK